MSGSLERNIPLSARIKAQFFLKEQTVLELNPWRQEKRSLRRKQLKNREVTAIHVNTEPLKNLLDYDIFRCVPTSSVARGEAIPGSDIDGAVVITQEEVPTTIQEAFIEELHKQGFDVYLSLANRAKNKWISNPNNISEQELFLELMHAEAIQTKAVTFITHNELRAKIAYGKMDLTTAVCIAGKDIA